MIKTIDDLPNCPIELKEIILKLQTELTSSHLKYEMLIEQLRLAKLHRYAPTSEKNIFQADLFDEAAIELSDDNTEPEAVEVKGHTRTKHPVRKHLPKDLPREVIEYDIPEEEKICECGANLVRIGQEISEQLKYIPSQLLVLQHLRHKYACKPCQENVKIAPMPMLFLPKSIATPELVAHTIVAKHSDHIPLYRQSAIWLRLDIDIPRSSMCSWLMKTYELCEPFQGLLQTNIICHDYTQADESTLQVLNEPGRANTTKSYLWVYKGGDLASQSIVFDYQETRGGYHAQNFLKDFKGFLQTDAYSGYNFTTNNNNIISIGCWAHARRPFAELAKISKKKGLAIEAIEYIQKLYAIEKYARNNNLTFEQRYKLRKEKAPIILDAFLLWLEKNITKVPKQHKIGQGIAYCLRHWDALTNYLQDGKIEIDNNGVENIIRPLALGRKNFLFAGSPTGAKAAALFYSLIATCKINNVDPYKYFCSMLHEVRSCNSDDDFKKLLPYSIQI